MAGLTIKDSDVKKILGEVEAEIGALLKSEKERLAKAAEESSSGARPEESSSPPPASPAGPESPAPSAPPVDSAAPASPSASPEGAPPESAPADPAADAGPVDPQALMEEYAKLPPEELKVHYMACKAALSQVMGADPDAASAGAPPASAPPPAAPPPGPAAGSPAPLAQAEVSASPGNGGESVPVKKNEDAPLAKSEREKSLEAEIEALGSQLEKLVKAVGTTLGQPVRKAITGVDRGPRGEAAAPAQELSKADIDAKLKEVIASKKLSKSESERVIAYSMGHVGFDQIKDLIEKK